MAVIKMGALCHSIKGKVEGSVFRTNTYGTVLYSNNWSKRGTGMDYTRNHFIQASIKSQFRNLTPEERAAWYQQSAPTLGQHQGQMVATKGSSKTRSA